MTKRYPILLTLLLFTLTLHAQKQKATLEEGDKKFDALAYMEANTIYTKFVAAGEQPTKAYSRLGDTYYLNANYGEALKWYELMYQERTTWAVDGLHLYRYAQALKSGQEYDKASAIIKEYNQFCIAKNCDTIAEVSDLTTIEKRSGRYKIKPVSINSDMPDFGATFYENNKIIYTSAKKVDALERIDKWSNMPFLKLYMADIKSDGDLKNPQLLEGKINGKYHQSTAIVTKDGKTIYFTRNNYVNGKLGKENKKIGHLGIYRATYSDKGIWKKIESLSINDKHFSNAHPALSADGKKLIFASDRPGSLGQTDLYETEIHPDGSLGEVVNLGPTINTSGRETFPFVAEDGKMYFATDGHPGLGGLDVFVAQQDSIGNYHVINVGKPVNSPQDDHTFIFNPESKKAYFASNRSGKDDIYYGTELRSIEDMDIQMLVYGVANDVVNDGIVPGMKITVYDENGILVGETYTDENGNYLLKVVPGTYVLKFEKDGKDFKDATITVPGDTENRRRHYDMDVDVVKGMVQMIEKKPVFKVSGHIMDSRDEIPIADMIITAYREDGTGIAIDESYANSDGSYELELPAGNYVIKFEHPDGNLIKDIALTIPEGLKNQRLDLDLKVDLFTGMVEAKERWVNSPEKTLYGKVRDRYTNELLSGVKVSAYDANGRKVEEYTTTENGEYILKVSEGDYTLRFEKNGIIIGESRVTVPVGTEKGLVEMDAFLEQNTDKNKTPSSAYDVPPVYFAFDRSSLGKQAKAQLDHVVELLKTNPSLSLDIRSYTDSRGNATYNMGLSERRTSAAINYILEQGIDFDRVSGRGYGEEYMVNSCSEGVLCEEVDHALNRRSEFIFIDHKK